MTTDKGGRKPLPDHQKRKRRVLYATDAEWEKVLRAAWEKVLRAREKEGGSDASIAQAG